MFSTRTRWDRTANRLSRILEAKRRAGTSVLDLTESNPTRAGFLCPADLLQGLADPASQTYDPDPAGLGVAREAVAADYRRRGFDVGAGRVVMTASTSEAYAFLFKLLADPGDGVLVPRPSYPLFDYLARLESLDVERYPLAYDGEWHIDLAALHEAITPRTRAVVVVNPNNPTGSFLKRGEARALGTLCARAGVAILSDEVFADYAFGPDAGRVTSLADDGEALAFSLGGLSKSCGLPQLKLGWIVVSGPPALRDEALARLEIVADTYLSVGTPVQRAAPRLLARLGELQAPIAERVRANRKILAQRLAGTPATLLSAEGGWYGVVQVPATISEEQRVCRLLEQRDVLLHPGFFFDFDREAFLVASLLPPSDVFARALEGLVGDLVL